MTHAMGCGVVNMEGLTYLKLSLGGVLADIPPIFFCRLAHLFAVTQTFIYRYVALESF